MATPPDPSTLAAELKAKARGLGFALVGIAPAEPSRHVDLYRRWLGAGGHGEMSYLARPDAVERRADLEGTLRGVRSVLVVAHEYFVEDPPGVPDDPSLGVIARYARGRDYHKVVEGKLRALVGWLERRVGGSVEARAYVDTGPVLERELARRAGLGWFGKNTMLLNPERGSYFFLGVLLLDLELPADDPFDAERCGSCTACLDACPTGALLGYDADGAPVMDATLCISYLTIEQKGPIAEELRPAIGNRVYGCDICQEVCPWNGRFARVTTEPGYAARGPGEQPVGVEALPGGDVAAETHPGTTAPPLVELLETALDEDRWEAFSRGSAIRRAGRAGFARNVCVAIGNWLRATAGPPPGAEAVLRDALEDEAPLVREHAAWALRQLE